MLIWNLQHSLDFQPNWNTVLTQYQFRLQQENKQTQTQLTLLSITHYSCIFTVGTVLNSNTMMGAVSQACLSLSATHLIIVDWTTASTEEGWSKKAVPTVKMQE